MRLHEAQSNKEPVSVSLPDKAQVIAALEDVVDPKSGQGLWSAGLVQGLVVQEARAA